MKEKIFLGEKYTKFLLAKSKWTGICIGRNTFGDSQSSTRKPVGFMQSCFLCWFPCGYLNNTWHPCGNPVVSCRNHIVSTFETLCCPPGNHIVSTWKPNGVHLETTWCAHGNHIISTWQPCSVHRNYMVSVWKPCDGHMETMWFSHRNYVVSIFESTYCPPGNHMVSTWKLGGVHLDTIWC